MEWKFNMTIVFEADVIVQVSELHRRQYELDDELIIDLLNGMTKEENPLAITIDELRDLLAGKGEISTIVKTAAKANEIQIFLGTLARYAWSEHLPWKMEQAEWISRDDGRFERYVRAYMTDEN